MESSTSTQPAIPTPIPMVTGVLVRVDGSVQSFVRPAEGLVGDVIGASMVETVPVDSYFGRMLKRLRVTEEERATMVAYVDENGLLNESPPNPWNPHLRGAVYFESCGPDGEPESLAPALIKKLTVGWKSDN